ncbi:hypothetical protein C8R44DRAFT_867973 [Mycena epipterygia]|nr:hypothetical protein C8R44DRAFT_867973 [Mycena epipterygia]
MTSAHSTRFIIIGVAASVGGILLAAILYLLLRRRPKKQVPLPPKQELARYREHHPHDLVPESRPQTWYDSGFLPVPSGTASNSSLLPSRGASPFSRPSLNTSESPSEDMSHLSAGIPMGLALPPHLPFDTSNTSLSTAETDSPVSSSPPPASASDSSFSHTPPRQLSSFSASSRPNRRSRPLSVGSSGSRNSRNTIRGVPHGPHSQIQIILPAPLAFNDRVSIHESSPRFSVVDQWAPAAVRSEANPIPTPQRRSFTEPRRSASQSSVSHAPNPRRAASASASASLPQRSPHPPSAHHNRDYSNHYSPLSPPPVPQIPQQWLPPSDLLRGIPEDNGRGRSRDVAPSALISERPPQPADRPPPPPPEGQRKLQKRSRSRG